MHLSRFIAPIGLTLLATLLALPLPANAGDEPTPRPTLVNEFSDLNRDNVVDAEDLLILMQDWGKVTGPEPLVEMVTLPAGSFLMGNSESERDVLFGADDEYPRHQVNINYSFEMGKFEVTNAQFAEILNWANERGYIRGVATLPYTDGNGYHNHRMVYRAAVFTEIIYEQGLFIPIVSNGQSVANYPANIVTWHGAVAFCNWLSEKEGRSAAYDLSNWTLTNRHGGGYRLPSESEWEYACRGSATNPNRYNLFSFGDDTSLLSYDCTFSAILDQYITWCGNPLNFSSRPVGSKLPNDYGLHDMHGSVSEWCEDEWHENYNGAPSDGSARLPSGVDDHVFRGGSWNAFAGSSRSANRARSNGTGNSIGFRIVTTP